MTQASELCQRALREISEPKIARMFSAIPNPT